MSPSISALGTNAATESITITSTAFDLISISVICIASSPLEGCDTSKVSSSTPSFFAQAGSSAMLLKVRSDTSSEIEFEPFPETRRVLERLPAEPTVLLERARIESAAARPDAVLAAVAKGE